MFIIAVRWAVAGLLAPFILYAYNAVGFWTPEWMSTHVEYYISLSLAGLWPFCFLLIGIGPETPLIDVVFRYAMSFTLNAIYFMCLGLLLYGAWSLLRRCCRRTR